MRIMVRTLRGDRVALDVDGADTATVAQVKTMVMNRERVPVAMQRLFFAGCYLDDDHRSLAHYGVQRDSVLFLGLHLLRADAGATAAAAACRLETMRSLGMPSESMAAEHEQQQQQVRVHVHDDSASDGGEEVKRKAVSRRSLRKILSRLHVDAWTRQRDAKFLDLLLRHTAGRRSASGGTARGVGELTGEEWSVIRAELNAATGSVFPVEELQRRLGEFRRELEAAGRLKSHPKFRYDARRRVVVATEADWKCYTLENPEEAAYEGRMSHLGRLRAIFSGDGGRGDARCRESRAKRCLGKLLRSFGLHCNL